MTAANVRRLIQDMQAETGVGDDEVHLKHGNICVYTSTRWQSSVEQWAKQSGFRTETIPASDEYPSGGVKVLVGRRSEFDMTGLGQGSILGLPGLWEDDF